MSNSSTGRGLPSTPATSIGATVLTCEFLKISRACPHPRALSADTLILSQWSRRRPRLPGVGRQRRLQSGQHGRRRGSSSLSSAASFATCGEVALGGRQCAPIAELHSRRSSLSMRSRCAHSQAVTACSMAEMVTNRSPPSTTSRNFRSEVPCYRRFCATSHWRSPTFKVRTLIFLSI